MSDTLFPPINSGRLWSRVEQLAKFTQPDLPWTRRAFSPLFDQARVWLRAQFEAAGMDTMIDAGGNLIGRTAGLDDSLAPIITGSHCDTVLGGGRFDGIIGVLAGIEVAQTMRETGHRLQHPFEVIDFLSEEPSDFGVSCVGSRAISGMLSTNMLQSQNQESETLAQAIARIGGQPDLLNVALRGPASTGAFIELHIEQGPVLESKGVPIGVVTNIVGIRRTLICIEGRPDHAGTTPMTIRCDALVGAAHVIQAVHQRASALSGAPHYVVATIGRLSLTPNAANAVPGLVELTLEVRSDNMQVLDTFAADIMADLKHQLTALRLTFRSSQISSSQPTDCSPVVMQAIETACRALRYTSMRMPSGAGHDGVYIAPTGPIGMIFIPCLNGRSHCAEEWIEPGQLLDGTRVLHQTILELDKALDSL